MKCVIALGFFDGVHLGHSALLEKARQEADRLGCAAVALTFDRHPDEVIFDKKTPLINTLSERVQMMKDRGMDEVMVQPFDGATMCMPWDAYVEKLRSLGAEAVVCGHDFTFGYRGKGNADTLRQAFGENCHVIEPVTVDGTVVSSTAIRKLLQSGKIEQANRLLGHNHFITGEVVHGNHLGRKLGTPTANLKLAANVLAPAYGVYAARVNGEMAVTNIGVRPTVAENGQVTVESWLPGVRADLYGKTVRVELLAYIRPEQKFESLTQLKEQIIKDAQAVQACLQE